VRSKNIPYQDDVKLAVAGDTGAGKSALLNAILGVLNLTIEVCNDYQLIDASLT
jgi:predicted GTPase